MDAREKQDLLESLETGRDVLLAALDGVSEDLATRVPEPGRWSVRECLEHLCLVENYLFRQIATSQLSETPVGSRACEARILQRGQTAPNAWKLPKWRGPPDASRRFQKR